MKDTMTRTWLLILFVMSFLQTSSQTNYGPFETSESGTGADGESDYIYEDVDLTTEEPQNDSSSSEDSTMDWVRASVIIFVTLGLFAAFFMYTFQFWVLQFDKLKQDSPRGRY